MILLFLLFVTVSATAQTDSDYVRVDALLESGPFDNAHEISVLVPRLSNGQRLTLYRLHQDDPLLPLALNAILPVGIGSWVQGNTVGGIVGSAGLVLGVALFVDANGMGPEAGVGLAVLGASYLTNLILPFTFSASRNEELRSILGVFDVSSISAMPRLMYDAHNRMVPGFGICVGM